MELINDTATITMFDWTNRKNLANRVEVDIKWSEAGGNTFVFLDTRLKDEKYVTVGLRQLENGVQQATMSVHKPNIKVDCRESYSRIGPEGDTCCIGNFKFEMGDWYRFIIYAEGCFIEGFIYDYKNHELTKLAKFYTGEDSLIKAGPRNSVSLEHIWMENPCEKKTIILCRDLSRLDINGENATASRVQGKYQDCDNSDIKKNSEGYIVISHGGDTKRGDIKNNDWIEVNYQLKKIINLTE